MSMNLFTEDGKVRSIHSAYKHRFYYFWVTIRSSFFLPTNINRYWFCEGSIPNLWLLKKCMPSFWVTLFLKYLSLFHIKTFLFETVTLTLSVFIKTQFCFLYLTKQSLQILIYLNTKMKRIPNPDCLKRMLVMQIFLIFSPGWGVPRWKDLAG